MIDDVGKQAKLTHTHTASLSGLSLEPKLAKVFFIRSLEKDENYFFKLKEESCLIARMHTHKANCELCECVCASSQCKHLAHTQNLSIVSHSKFIADLRHFSILITIL